MLIFLFLILSLSLHISFKDFSMYGTYIHTRIHINGIVSINSKTLQQSWNAINTQSKISNNIYIALTFYTYKTIIK